MRQQPKSAVRRSSIFLSNKIFSFFSFGNGSVMKHALKVEFLAIGMWKDHFCISDGRTVDPQLVKMTIAS